METRPRWSQLWPCAALAAVACRAPQALPALDLRVSAELTPPSVPAGWPLLVRYRFETGPGFVAPAGAEVFAHLVTPEGTLLVAGDHAPTPGFVDWRPGQVHEYTRVLFTARQFPGPLELRAGIFDPASGRRWRLDQPHLGRGEHRLATLETTAGQGARLSPLFGRGFYGPEGDATQPFVARRWMGREAELSLRHPGAGEALLLLSAWTARGAFEADPELEVLLGGRRTVHRIRDHRPFLLALRAGPGELGAGPWVDVHLRLDRDFQAAAPDARRLALCLEQALLLPVAELPAELPGLAGP